MRRLTRRRQFKKRSKHSRNNKYNKTRGQKYIKKRRYITRRRVLRGGDDDVQYIIDAINISSPERFRLLVDGLENKPKILHQHRLQDAYKRMIELRKDGAPTGYIGLAGLKFLNYLWSRIQKLLPNHKDEAVVSKLRNLQTAISLMDQLALAPGVVNEQLPTIRKLSPDPYYYSCYEKLFNILCSLMSLKSREIPLSSSACHMNDICSKDNDDVCNSQGECCLPINTPVF